MDLSVIVCSHNPRQDYLAEVIDSLKGADLRRSEWELIVVDNASERELSGEVSLGWHPSGRLIREEELGLIAARLRGFREARGTVIVFVDDDNVLAPSYLEICRRISDEWPRLGAWGGSIRGRFEEEPEEGIERFLGLLAVRSVEKKVWSNVPGQFFPFGAGLCVRREVMERYSGEVGKSVWLMRLGRKGSSLAGGEDKDIVHTAWEMGLGAGLFPELQLEHLIPAERVQRSYLCRISEEVSCSSILQAYGRNGGIRYSRLDRLVGYIRALKAPAAERGIRLAKLRGEARARRMIRRSESVNG